VDVLRLNIVVPIVGASGLYIALAMLTSANRFFLRANPGFPSIYDSGVRYLRDAEHGSQASPDNELWLTIPDAVRYGGADCKVLAAWRAAELLEQGELAAPFLIEPPPGSRLWHVVVRREDGTLEDPSKILGMKGPA